MSARILRFGTVGIVNTAIGLAVIYVALYAGLGDFPSNALGYGCGLVVSFLLHRGWTFADRTRSLPRDAIGFVIAWIVAYSTNLAVIALGRSLGFIDNPFVQLAGVSTFAIIFYLATSRVVFAAGSAEPDATARADRLQSGCGEEDSASSARSDR